MMKKLTALVLITAMLLSCAVAFALEAKVPNSAAYLYADQKPVVEEKSIVADPDWSIRKTENVELAALGALFASSKESAAVVGNYYEWLVMEGYGDKTARKAAMTDVDPFSASADCIGAVEVKGGKVTTVAAAYDDEQIKGIIAEYRKDAFNSLISYSVLAEVKGVAYLYHYNAYGNLMEVTTNTSYFFANGYSYNGEGYPTKTKVNEAIEQDIADGTYDDDNEVTFGILEVYPTVKNTKKSAPKINFTRLVPSVSDMIRGINY